MPLIACPTETEIKAAFNLGGKFALGLDGFSGSFYISIVLDIVGGSLRIAIKIDIKKVFEIINWNFLIKVLGQFRFYSTFFGWISTIFHYVLPLSR